jgi:hypothetical protein
MWASATPVKIRMAEADPGDGDAGGDDADVEPVRVRTGGLQRVEGSTTISSIRPISPFSRATIRHLRAKGDGTVM